VALRTLRFHGPLYAGLGTFEGFHSPSSSSSQSAGYSNKELNKRKEGKEHS